MIAPIANISHTNRVQILPSRNPLKLFKMMKMYSIERKESLPRLEAIINTINVILTNCKMRFIKDSFGNILAAYTYKFRKNHAHQTSMYIDTLVRNRKIPETKEMMKYIYQDMKNIAITKNAKELTLFSGINDYDLQTNYKKLGFKTDNKTFVPGGYIMRVNTADFLNN